MNEFKEKFNSYSTANLLKIIDNPGDYQASAVEAANEILKSRQLDELEIETAKTELQNTRQEIEKKNQKYKDLEFKVKDFFSSILSVVNPIQSNITSVDKTIKLVCISLGLIFLFQLFKNLKLFSFYFTNNLGIWNLFSIFYFIDLFIIPITIVLFYKRKKIGWTILMIYITSTIISNVFYIVFLIYYQIIRDVTFNLRILAQSSFASDVISLLFYAGIFWTITKSDILEVFLVNRKYLLITIGISIALISLYLIIIRICF
ncbi:MAG: hypothetical protein IPK18_10570 [Sphingobacteriales bacterium]|jgi:hypothetical protein|nr:MAG: hypothetical protein IPK18_10570 [Sphingobacteriales bacterium]